MTDRLHPVIERSCASRKKLHRGRTIFGSSALLPLLILGLVLGLLPGPAGAATTVKLATLAPDGSIWDQAVEEMGASWKEETDGRVDLRIYPGGVAGDESAVVRKMRIGQIHAAVLTQGGLAEIDEAFSLFVIPFFFESYEELYFVLDELRPTLEKRLADKGYVLLNWGHAGWVHLFSKEPVATTQAMKNTKFFVTAGDDRMLNWWKDQGYKPVPLSSTDIVTGLQTGMIEALPSPPLAALMLQWYKNAPNMLDMGFAPLVGATVVQERIWRRISDEDQKSLQSAAGELEDRLEKEVPEQDEKAIAAMEKRGLNVVKVEGTPEADRWRSLAQVFADNAQESWVPADVLRQALDARKRFRASHSKSEAGR